MNLDERISKLAEAARKDGISASDFDNTQGCKLSAWVRDNCKFNQDIEWNLCFLLAYKLGEK